jgi:hypothetical protein
MRNTVHCSILAALLVGVVTAPTAAQTVASVSDTLRPASPLPPNVGAIGRKSNLLPPLQIAGFLALLSVYDRIAFPNEMQDGKKVYGSTFASTWDHITTQHWVYDLDPFNVNQFRHPYQGATMYGLARSTGHAFWSSLIHANVGSFVWKMAGETDPPSINDMITTGQAGALLGEALYRMANLILTDSIAPSGPPRWHGIIADMMAPSSALNRHAFGDHFRTQLPPVGPKSSWQVRLGVNLDAIARDYSSPGTLLRKDAAAEFWMSYGLPGQPGYDYKRPLDYFDLQFTLLATASNPVENVMLRGLLVGRKTRDRVNSRGIWGLYGTYDYISPYLFRVSSTALSLGTTRQHWLTPGLALQGSLLGGVGYGAAGSTTIIASTPTNAAIRDYHFGVTPQALLALRLIAGDRVMLDMAGRGYYVSGLGSDDKLGSERIFRGSLALNVRIGGGHTLGARFVASTRDARYGTLPNREMSEGTITLAYSFLGSNHFSAVKWQ